MVHLFCYRALFPFSVCTRYSDSSSYFFLLVSMHTIQGIRNISFEHMILFCITPLIPRSLKGIAHNWERLGWSLNRRWEEAI